jgi:glutamate dehydrogenase/leucine dehydrogenase
MIKLRWIPYPNEFGYWTIQRWTSFSPVCESKYLEILAFEQTFKTANHIANGWWKGGADFDPKGKSDNEVMRFVKVS